MFQKENIQEKEKKKENQLFCSHVSVMFIYIYLIYHME